MPNLTKLAMRLDPVAMALVAGYHLDDWQAEVLQCDDKRLLLNCARQTGKSLTCALLALHTALFTQSLVILLSPTLRQSGELFKHCAEIYVRLGCPIPAESETLLRLELTNGSRILSLPGASDGGIRGLSGVSLIVIDEAARVDDSLYKAVRPMLATSGGRLLALSTPYGSQGWWFDAWHSREPWSRLQVRADECPRIPKSFLAEERRAMGEWWYAQEYECRFMESQGASFRAEDVNRLIKKGMKEWNL